jgi:putative oxygen-independent coproporphyrinogen III oxidase
MVPFGVYVHVPFCTSRCDYCAFATWTDRFHLVDAYVHACIEDLARLAGEFGLRGKAGQPAGAGQSGRPATSVFFGGGTPSLLEPDQLAAVLAAIDRAPGAEVTVECNPETVDRAKLEGYRRAGVTRLSFGVQSMAAHVLRGLGRRHDPAAVRRAATAAGEAGFAASFSVDLIMGGADESYADWGYTLAEVLALDPAPTHVSAYGLTVEPGTPLAADPARHPDPDDQADKYVLADSVLHDAGFEWYEISNWARPGSECRHNQIYWAQGEYAGVGCAAHSHRIDRSTGWSRRWWNVRTPDRYIRLVGQDLSVEASGEDLDPATRRTEALELELRTRAGVPDHALPGWRDEPLLAGLLEPASRGRVRLTTRGRLLANEVALRLVPEAVVL